MLDVNLPGLSGYEVINKLKQDEKTARIPTLALSANAMPEDMEKGKQAGFDDYLTKPVDVRALLKSLQSFL